MAGSRCSDRFIHALGLLAHRAAWCEAALVESLPFSTETSGLDAAAVRSKHEARTGGALPAGLRAYGRKSEADAYGRVLWFDSVTVPALRDEQDPAWTPRSTV